MSFRFDFGGSSAAHNSTDNEMEAKSEAVEAIPSSKVLPPQNDKLSLVMGETVVSINEGHLFRRCLADMKVEAAESNVIEGGWLDRVMLENTDLINGVYEGGFKTWECSLDMVKYLDEFSSDLFRGKRILELGCGSALPGLYCLAKGSHVDFQDYNELVIKMVTMPNVLINTVSKPVVDGIDERGTFEVEVQMSQLNQISCGFYAGDWGSLNPNGDDKYDMILTSETIYSTESHQKLHNVMRRSLTPGGHILVAAKKTYFGCSGDLLQFLMLVQKLGVFSIETKREFALGVHRVIVQLAFL
ncbi:hypothetical protein BC830DRAFT_1116790 [Chytriomyces sp. MP71]|nr:hypothetical protein BC830DRAFT_1116790 [Chytriomyces sp. MP71]